jgi:hypothetical protein
MNPSCNLHCFFVIVELEMYRNIQLDLQALRMWLLRLFLYMICTMSVSILTLNAASQPFLRLQLPKPNSLPNASSNPKKCLAMWIQKCFNPVPCYATNPVPKHQHAIQYHVVQTPFNCWPNNHHSSSHHSNGHKTYYSPNETRLQKS